MDYITQQIDKSISFYSSDGASQSLVNYYRIKIEYALIFLMAYLWNRNIDNIDPDSKEYVISKIFGPTIGTVIDICRNLDCNKEIFSNRKFVNALDKYPSLRNDKIGHGFVFEDAVEKLHKELQELSQVIYEVQETPLSASFDLVLVTKVDNEKYSGISFKANGNDYVHWRCTQKVQSFEINNVYSLSQNNQYVKLSPFIEITPEHEFYIFRDIQDRLIGKVRYNQLFKTGIYSRSWPALHLEIENDGKRRRTANGTIINLFEKNYRAYIDIGMKREIYKFLTGNKSSVCATIWGHGGVGKTATVQSICDDLSKQETKLFDYVVFVSAKDRYYDYCNGAIKTSSSAETIDSLEELVMCINETIGNTDSPLISEFSNIEGKFLIVIDDYETFPNSEKIKIENWIKQLDINQHKVLITTRANLVVGIEFQTNELDLPKAKQFLLEVLRTEFSSYDIKNAERELNSNSNLDSVYAVTNGRPLFIFQFAYIWAQCGSLKDSLHRNIKTEPAAVSFLYGRIFEYLSSDAKILFVAISQLLTKDDLTNLVDKLKYVVNFENREEKFESAFNELTKLRIVESIEGDFFRVYSREIFQIMLDYFNKADPLLRGNINSRIQQVTRDKKLDNEHALLENANAARYVKSEEEVISQFRQILNRASSPFDVKLSAILNLTDYLFNQRGKQEQTMSLIDDFKHIFYTAPLFARMHANFAWSTGNKNEAIQVLAEFVHSRQINECDYNLALELKGLFLTFSSIDGIEQKEELKTRKRFNEISSADFYKENDEIKLYFSKIYQFGNLLFQSIKNKPLVNLKTAARQNLMTGFYRFLDICIRSNKYANAEQICIYFINNPTNYLQDGFKRKLGLIKDLQ